MFNDNEFTPDEFVKFDRQLAKKVKEQKMDRPIELISYKEILEQNIHLKKVIKEAHYLLVEDRDMNDAAILLNEEVEKWGGSVQTDREKEDEEQ